MRSFKSDQKDSSQQTLSRVVSHRTEKASRMEQDRPTSKDPATAPAGAQPGWSSKHRRPISAASRDTRRNSEIAKSLKSNSRRTPRNLVKYLDPNCERSCNVVDRAQGYSTRTPREGTPAVPSNSQTPEQSESLPHTRALESLVADREDGIDAGGALCGDESGRT